jgi:hypothetical protein
MYILIYGPNIEHLYPHFGHEIVYQWGPETGRTDSNSK